MCYRDRTYCNAPCATVTCSRFVTPEVERGAQRTGLPIVLGDFRDRCGKFVRAPSTVDGTGKLPAKSDAGEETTR